MDKITRIQTLKDLAEEYFLLPKGAIIEKPHEILRIISLYGTDISHHPHLHYRVYISRKALKNFVESRKESLGKRHSHSEVLVTLMSMIEQLPSVLFSFDTYEYEPKGDKHFYTKYFSQHPSIRVLVEQKEERILQICSIHPTKRKKKK